MMIFIFVLAVLVFVLVGEWWSRKHKLEGISAEYYCSKALVDIDEEIPMHLTIRNAGRRLIPYLSVKLAFPRVFEGIAEQKKMRKDQFGEKEVTWTTWLGPESEASFQVLLYGKKRGRYVLKKARISDGDFLGILEDHEEVQSFPEIVIAPKESEDPYIQATMGSFLGMLSVQRFLFEDPILTMGHRDYTGTEPFKSIDWMQSAKGHGLMVKTFDHTTDVRVTVLLDLGSDTEQEVLEECYCMTRTVCRILEEKAYPYRLLTNAKFDLLLNQLRALQNEEYHTMQSDYGLGESHFYIIRDILGRAINTRVTDLAQLMESAAENDMLGAEYILITPDRNSLTDADTLQIHGRKPLILAPKGGEQV